VCVDSVLVVVGTLNVAVFGTLLLCRADGGIETSVQKATSSVGRSVK
jgi:hypothetical protein